MNINTQSTMAPPVPGGRYLPSRTAEGATYRVLRRLDISGVLYQPGDLIPQDSPVRSTPTILERLVRVRQLEIVAHVAQPHAVAQPAAQPKAAPLLATPTIEELLPEDEEPATEILPRRRPGRPRKGSA